MAYDPTYAYELAVIIHDGLRRMYAEQENIFYYITVMNENYAQPAHAARASRQGILKRRLPAADRRPRQGARDAARLAARSCAKCLAAAKILENDYGIPADVYSVTSFSELRREALECERWNLLHPGETRARAVRASSCCKGARAR